MNFDIAFFNMAFLFCLLGCILIATPATGQEIDDKIMSKVLKMANGELKKIYSGPQFISKTRDIKSTMKLTETTEPVWSDHPDVDLYQVSFDVEVRYNKVIDPSIGEIASFREVLRCVLGKYRSFKWNRLTLTQNDCQDCEGDTLVELKRALNKRYIAGG